MHKGATLGFSFVFSFFFLLKKFWNGNQLCHVYFNIKKKKKIVWGLPRHLLVKTPHSQCMGHDFHPWSGNYDPTFHVVQKKSLNTKMHLKAGKDLKIGKQKVMVLMQYLWFSSIDFSWFENTTYHSPKCSGKGQTTENKQQKLHLQHTNELT